MRVLIADDEPLIRRSLERVFSKAGHEVFVAEGRSSGDQPLARGRSRNRHYRRFDAGKNRTRSYRRDFPKAKHRNHFNLSLYWGIQSGISKEAGS